jgi:hypothetical protein
VVRERLSRAAAAVARDATLLVVEPKPEGE